MDSTVWIAIIASAVGTFLIRVLPLVWMQHHLKRQGNEGKLDAMPKWLMVLGPLMIAAMLGASLVPSQPSYGSWLATICGIMTTVLVWRKTRSLGIPVFTGVMLFGVVSVIASTFQ